ncbi:hypothetical protein YPPY71_1724, partial [Yersinia pestis PY-71]
MPPIERRAHKPVPDSEPCG